MDPKRYQELLDEATRQEEQRSSDRGKARQERLRRRGDENLGDPSREPYNFDPEPGEGIQHVSGTTGDIIWRHVDPKTWELSNTPTADTVPIPDTSPAAGLTDATGQATTDSERDIMKQMMMAEGMKPKFAPSPETKKLWRRQLRQFHKSLKDPSADVTQGVQELFDSGALSSTEENGGGDIYTNVPTAPSMRGKIVDAVKQWQNDPRRAGWAPDRQDDQSSTYQKQQQDMMEQFGRMMGGLAGGQ